MKVAMRKTLSTVAIFFLLAGTLLSESYENPPVLDASKILPAELYQGEYHHVDKRVTNDGYVNSYLMKSQFGDYRVGNTLMLLKRVYESHAIAALEEHASEEVVADAGVDAAKGIVMAPVRGVRKVGEFVSDTDKMEKTARSIPGGIYNLFSSAAKAVGTGAEVVYEGGKSAAKGEFGGAGERTGDVAGSAAGYALDWIGYNKKVNEWAKLLKVDPYTKNDELRAQLRRLASLQTSVGLASKLAPAMIGVPGVAVANKYIGNAERLAGYDDPEKVEKLNRQIYKTLGEDDDVVEGFLSNEHYTPISQTLFTDAIKRLKGVKDTEGFLIMAAEARSREESLFYIVAATKLAEYHEKEKRLDQLIRNLELPAAVTANGHLIVPLPVDHLCWTRDVARIFRGAKQRIAKEHKIVDSEIRVSGTMSSRCREELKNIGVKSIREKAGY